MLQEDALLALWERSVGQPPWRRDDVLLGDGTSEPPSALDARNAALLARHRAWFGAHLALMSSCPACATATEFTADAEMLADGLERPAPDGPQSLDVHGHHLEFRLPERDDVAWAAEVPQAFDERLLQRCVLVHQVDGQPAPPHALPAPLRAALAQRMEALAPGASLGFELDCPACAAHWSAPLDVGRLLWQQLQARAEQLLLDVDTLARAYGWTEPEVLALSPVRRAAYLQMATA